MDPCYTDFDELEFLSIASYNNRESKRSVTSPISFVQQFTAMSMLGWGGGGGQILHFIDSIRIQKESIDLGGNPS